MYTSNTDDYFQSSLDEWRTNGAGLRYSHQFGFGVADAEAMVTRAKHWVNVPQQYEDTVEPQTTSGSVCMPCSVGECAYRVQWVVMHACSVQWVSARVIF